MLFGLYVVFHGHYSPGGGFQGGAILAASVILLRIALDEKVNQLQFNKVYSIPLASLGVLIFFGVGLISLIFGGYFLDYSLLPFGDMDIPDLRSTGILLVEIGVGLAVMAILISIYDNLLEDDDV